MVDRSSVSYDPRRLRGVNVFREVEKEFAKGDRVQFTATSKDLGIANRDLGTVVSFEEGKLTLWMDGRSARVVQFNPESFRQFDHGYAVTSHSSQGLTACRVLVNMDTAAHPELIHKRFAYVSVSRASEDAQVYTNDATTLAERLSIDISKASAVEVAKPKSDPATEKAQSPAEIDHRHYAPLHNALPNSASDYEWKRETGDIQSYQHNQTAGWLHLDPQGQFYDRHAQPIPKEHALEKAGHLAVAVNEISQAQSIAKGIVGTEHEMSL